MRLISRIKDIEYQEREEQLHGADSCRKNKNQERGKEEGVD